MAQTNSLDFSSPAGADSALKLLTKLMNRAGQQVVTAEFSDKPRRTAGVTFREAFLTIASGQMITLRVNSTGDIYQVLLNNQVKPIKEHADTEKAVAEIASMAEKNQAAFQKAQARKAVALPKGMNTPKPRLAEALRTQVSELDAQLVEKRATVADLRAKLGIMVDSTSAPADGLGDAALDVLRQLDKADGQALEDGDVASKQGRDQLVELGLVDRYTDAGDNVLNDKGRSCLAMLDAVSSVYGEHEPMLLSGAYVAACEVVKADGSMLDSASAAGAVGYLQVALDIMETNCPINLAEGNIAQARLEARNAASFRAALAMLDSVGDPGDVDLQLLVEIAQADVVDENSISNQEALAALLKAHDIEAAEGLYFVSEKGRLRLNVAGYDAYGKPLSATE